MNIRQKKILFLLLCTAAVQLYTVINYRLMIYLSDSVRSYAIGIYYRITPGPDSFNIIRPAVYKKYMRTYRELPAGYTHCGYLLFYKAPADIRLKALADNSLKYTHYFKTYQLEQAIRESNRLRDDTVRKNGIVYIPYSLPALLPDIKKASRPALIFTRGLYYTGSTAGNERMQHTLDKYVALGINTVVFDAKDITGIVNYRSHTPGVIEYNTHEKRSIDDIDKLIRSLRSKGLYIIARIALFRDHLLFQKKPEFAIHSRKTGGAWNAQSNELWVDPTNRHVQDYNIALAIELAEKGVDEIQFDYIRFPCAGDLRDARYAYHFGRMSNEAAISQFLKRAYAEISRRNTNLSIDIFGVVAWGKETDIRSTGQRIELMAASCDAISPMLYPSHFSDNFDGFERPGDNPYYFMHTGCKKVMALARGRAVRPWLQAFRWHTSVYDENYILEQIKAAGDAGAFGYLLWNASNNYETAQAALAKLASSKAPKKKERARDSKR